MTKQNVRLPLVEQVLQEMMGQALGAGSKQRDANFFSVAGLARSYAEYCRAVDQGKSAVAARRLRVLKDTVRFYATGPEYDADAERKAAITAKFEFLLSAAKGQKARGVVNEQMFVEFDRSTKAFRRAEKKALKPYLEFVE
jgi:hypothetical protein